MWQGQQQRAFAFQLRQISGAEGQERERQEGETPTPTPLVLGRKVSHDSFQKNLCIIIDTLVLLKKGNQIRNQWGARSANSKLNWFLVGVAGRQC